MALLVIDPMFLSRGSNRNPSSSVKAANPTTLAPWVST